MFRIRKYVAPPAKLSFVRDGEEKDDGQKDSARTANTREDESGIQGEHRPPHGRVHEIAAGAMVIGGRPHPKADGGQGEENSQNFKVGAIHIWHRLVRLFNTLFIGSITCSVEAANKYTRMRWVLKNITCRGTNYPFVMWMENRSWPYRCGAKQINKLLLKCAGLLGLWPHDADDK